MVTGLVTSLAAAMESNVAIAMRQPQLRFGLPHDRSGAVRGAHTKCVAFGFAGSWRPFCNHRLQSRSVRSPRKAGRLLAIWMN